RARTPWAGRAHPSGRLELAFELRSAALLLTLELAAPELVFERPARDIDAAQDREALDDDRGCAGRTRARRAVLESAHDAEAGDVHLGVLGNDDLDAAHERPGV